MNISTTKNNFTKRHLLSALVILSLLNMINQIDRRALVTIFPLLKLEWGVSDTQLGLAVSLFTLGRTLISLPAGWIADRKGILPILRPMVIIWSLFTLASAWVGRFITFVILRFGVGLGDGANGPLDLAYLGHISPEKKRGTYLAIYSTALYFGSGIGVIYAGLVGENFGWRWVFIIPGILGLIAALGLIFLPRVKLRNEEYTDSTSQKQNPFSFNYIRQKPLPMVFLGASMGVFSSTAVVSWLPTYLTRQFDMNLSNAGLITGGVIIPASLLGTLLGGWISDKFNLSRVYRRILLSMVAFSSSMVFGLAGLFSFSLNLNIVFLFLFGLCITIPVSPLLVVVQESVDDKNLATTQAAFGLTTQIIGAAPATALVGILSDTLGLQTALTFPFIATGIGALILFISIIKLKN